MYVCVCVCVITAATVDLYAIPKGKKSTGYTASQLLHLGNMLI